MGSRAGNVRHDGWRGVCAWGRGKLRGDGHTGRDMGTHPCPSPAGEGTQPSLILSSPLGFLPDFASLDWQVVGSLHWQPVRLVGSYSPTQDPWDKAPRPAPSCLLLGTNFRFSARVQQAPDLGWADQLSSWDWEAAGLAAFCFEVSWGDAAVGSLATGSPKLGSSPIPLAALGSSEPSQQMVHHFSDGPGRVRLGLRCILVP